MKVCHFITRLIVGGAQENTFLSARGLVEAGHECVMLSGPSEGREGQLLSKMKNPGFEVVENPLFVREISPFVDYKAIRSLVGFLKKRKFDVIHTHSSKAGILGRIAGREAGVPMVAHTIHGLAFGPYESALKNFIYIHAERFAAKRCDRIYSVAQAMIDQCLAQKIGRPEQFKVVYSGMELDRFLEARPDEKLRAELNIPAGRKVVGAVARLFPRKGYEDFFPVAAEVVGKRPDTHFLILGDGPRRTDYENWVKSLGIEDHVSFAGLVPPDEVARYIALTDAVAHFSLKEGLPRVAVQALAEEKPVVAYPLDGTPEVVIDGRTGFLTPPGDHAAAAGALIRILSDDHEARRMGQAGRALVKDKFPWQKMSDTLIRDYEEFLSRKKK
ncbi:MAG: 2-deoxystreptamine glucosyltransferase [Lentisphaerae bacterium ADurb.Bin242]|nr:MAG: 2-deoxystreptamine glucosyltransferase [Lentisphaerae bacterium ADurb.Bin242]